MTNTVEIVDEGARILRQAIVSSAMSEEDREYCNRRAESEAADEIAPGAEFRLRRFIVFFCMIMASLSVVLMIGVLALSILVDVASAIAASAVLATSLICFMRTIGQVVGGSPARHR